MNPTDTPSPTPEPVAPTPGTTSMPQADANAPSTPPAAPPLTDTSNTPVGEGIDPKMPDPARVEAFKRNMAFMWAESLELCGMPFDSLLGQVFQTAAQQGMAAGGKMINFGAGPRFVPTRETMALWLDTFFGLAMVNDGNDMPEA